MSHPVIHAESSARRFGGKPEDYLDIHNWFDATKAWCATMAHRAMRHHSEGIFEAGKVFGEYIINSDGKRVYTRYIGEQHVFEDLGWIPTAKDWLDHMNMDEWMVFSKKESKRKRLNID